MQSDDPSAMPLLDTAPVVNVGTARTCVTSIITIASVKTLPRHGDRTSCSGSLDDLASLKRSLDARLPYTVGELAGLASYEDSLKLLLEKLRSRVQNDHGYLSHFDSIHSLSLAVDRSRFIMSAVLQCDLDSYLDETLHRFGPLIDLVWRHCDGYPGCRADGSYDADDRARVQRWLQSVLIDPSSSVLYVRGASHR